MPHRSSVSEAAIVDAFVALALTRRYHAIRVADLIAHADVGRSTFYEHFRGKNDVLLVAMRPVLLALATAASGRASRSYVRAVVDHLWQQRSIVRSILDSTAVPIIERRLATMIAEHGGRTLPTDGVSLFAIGAAAAQVAMLRWWVAGRVTASTDAMTDQLIACSRSRDDRSSI